eukprot:4352726-Karenia_brevis.AAC.1
MKQQFATFSGTSTKWAQRAVNASAAKTRTVLFTLDISRAFFKGMSFQETSRLTGEPLRSLHFEFPKDDIHLLRQLPGME